MKILKIKFLLNIVVSVILTLGLSISLQSVFADWDPPIGSPPTCTGCAVNLNSGSVAQQKSGSLWITGPTIAGDYTLKADGKLVADELCYNDGASGNNCRDLSDSWISGDYVQKTGDTMIGDLNLPGLTATSTVFIDYEDRNKGSLSDVGLRFGGVGSGEGIASYRDVGQYGLDFYTRNTNRLSIQNNGNVGIGTSTSDKKLHVMGSIGIGDYGGIGLNDGNGRINIYSSAFTNTYLQPEAANRISLNTDGIKFYTAPAGANKGDAVAWSEKMRIENSGNVGIGTDSPSSKLEVDGGPIKATGGLIIETRTDDPGTPADGQIWLRTDL